MISREDAVEIARRAAAGIAELQEGSPVRVERDENRYVVTFVHLNAPGVRGPDYDARVTLDANDGEVIEFLGAS